MRFARTGFKPVDRYFITSKVSYRSHIGKNSETIIIMSGKNGRWKVQVISGCSVAKRHIAAFYEFILLDGVVKSRIHQVLGVKFYVLG